MRFDEKWESVCHTEEENFEIGQIQNLKSEIANWTTKLIPHSPIYGFGFRI
jgi:hypothetical protein